MLNDMNSRPLISILTPVYNRRAYIPETIRSVLTQSYENWEWILLDDGSTDGTGEIIQAFKDSRIHYFYQEHAGVDHLARTFNSALARSHGTFIAMLDSDDYWPPDKLEVQVRYFDDPDVVLSYGECELVNQNGETIYTMRLPEDPGIAGNRPTGSSLGHALFSRYGFIANSTVMMKKDALLSIGGFVNAEGLYQDFPTWMTLALYGPFAAVPRCLGYYRRHTSAISFNAEPGRGEDPWYRLDLRLAFIREFIARNRARLDELGFSFDVAAFEKRWEDIRRESVPYVPYNRAMMLLRLGLMKDAREEFRRFLAERRSLKHGLIYCLFVLSAFTRHDLVTPFSAFRETWRNRTGRSAFRQKGWQHAVKKPGDPGR
jgi:glycosyltransferase involved in cell wall biosynthesis